jgi:hypothetical protein
MLANSTLCSLFRLVPLNSDRGMLQMVDLVFKQGDNLSLIGEKNE